MVASVLPIIQARNRRADMAIRGNPLVLTYLAWNTSTGAPQTGDAANHMLRYVRDGVESTPANAPAEVDATNAKGLYTLRATAAEMTCDSITLGGVSSTANVVIIPLTVTTEHGLLAAIQAGADAQVFSLGVNNWGQPPSATADMNSMYTFAVARTACCMPAAASARAARRPPPGSCLRATW